jgi:hypothetical protein
LRSFVNAAVVREMTRASGFSSGLNGQGPAAWFARKLGGQNLQGAAKLTSEANSGRPPSAATMEQWGMWERADISAGRTRSRKNLVSAR